ncbi:MAG: hypothetical protein WD895_03340 [Acidimicrobiia bacterium]
MRQPIDPELLAEFTDAKSKFDQTDKDWRGSIPVPPWGLLAFRELTLELRDRWAKLKAISARIKFRPLRLL